MTLVIKLCPQHQVDADKVIGKMVESHPEWTEKEWETFFFRQWQKDRKTINTHCLAEVNGLEQLKGGYKIA